MICMACTNFNSYYGCLRGDECWMFQIPLISPSHQLHPCLAHSEVCSGRSDKTLERGHVWHIIALLMKWRFRKDLEINKKGLATCVAARSNTFPCYFQRHKGPCLRGSTEATAGGLRGCYLHQESRYYVGRDTGHRKTHHVPGGQKAPNRTSYYLKWHHMELKRRWTIKPCVTSVKWKLIEEHIHSPSSLGQAIGSWHLLKPVLQSPYTL